MVAIGSIQLGNRGDLNRATGALVWVGVAAAGIHLAALTLGWFMAAGLGWDRSTRIGVALASSQKTLMVGLKIAVDAGVSIVPIVAYHILQLVIDAALVKRGGRARKQPTSLSPKMSMPKQKMPRRIARFDRSGVDG